MLSKMIVDVYSGSDSCVDRKRCNRLKLTCFRCKCRECGIMKSSGEDVLVVLVSLVWKFGGGFIFEMMVS